MSNLVCPKCEKDYSLLNPPKKLINCSHTICLACLKTEILCPVDHKRIERRKYTIEGFQNDHDALQLITKGDDPSEHITKGQHKAQVCQQQQLLQHVAPQQEKDFQNGQVPRKSVQPGPLHFQLCVQHCKPRDLLCLQDKRLICSNCGLFGEHRGHSLMPYDQFALSFGTLAEQCLQISKHLEERRNKANMKGIQTRIEAELSLKRKKEIDKIDSFIRSLLDAVNKCKSQLIQLLETTLEQKKKDLVTSIVSGSSLLGRTDNFMRETKTVTQGLNHIFAGRSIGQYVQYVDSGKRKSQLAQEGLDLIENIDEVYKTSTDLVIEEMKKVGFSFSQPRENLFDQFVRNLATEKANHPHSPKRKKEQEDILLTQNDLSSNVQNFNHSSLSPIVPVDSFEYTPEDPNLIEPPLCHTLQPSAINLPKHSDFKASLPYHYRQSAKPRKDLQGKQSRSQAYSVEKSLFGSDLTLERELLRTSNNQKLLGRRKKKLQLPEKYGKIYDDLQKDHLDVLDLGGAFLGDSTICRILELVPTRQRLKAVKLMNNKLTDQSLEHIIEQCRNVSTLNLSYNLLTDKVLDFIELNSQKLGALENIALSHNKIVLRNVKDRIECLKRQGIKVSL